MNPLESRGVYAIRNKLNGDLYIGSVVASTFKRRWGKHRSDLRLNRHRARGLQNCWNTHGGSVLEFIILELVPTEEQIDRNYIFDLEQMWLDSYQPAYNTSTFANSNKGVKRLPRTQEHRAKISASRKGWSNPNKGHQLWAGREHPFQGKNHRQETILKNCITQRPDPLNFFHPIHGTHTVINLSAFCRERGLDTSNMSKVGRGKLRSYKGWSRGY